MARIDIKFKVEKQKLTLLNKEPLRAADKNYFYATFDLCETWSNIEGIKAAFERDTLAFVVELAPGADDCLECLIPWEVMADKGNFTVGVFGGDLLLTNKVRLEVSEGCYCEGGVPLAPTKDWFSKMEEQVEGLSFANNPLPVGGASGQVLAKASDEDYDLKWIDQTGGGSSVEVENAVLYTEQNLSVSEKEQARINIGAVSEGKVTQAINEAVSGLASEQYVTEATSNFVTEAQVNTKLDDYATNTYVDEAIEKCVSDSDLTSTLGEYVTETEMNTAIAGIAALPSVSAADNGKFLRVVDGVWAAASVANAEEVKY